MTSHPAHFLKFFQTSRGLGVPVIKASKGRAPSSHFPVGVRLPVDSARQGAARHAWRTSGRPGSLLTLAPGRRRRSPASGSHRTERADFPHSALRKLIHSTASACSSRCGRRKRALLRGSKTDPQRPLPTDPLTTDSVRRRPTKLSHLIEDVTCEDGLRLLPRPTARSKALPDDQRVPEESVLHTGLLMVARVLLPLSPSSLLHLSDRAVARGRSWSPSRHGGCPGRWNDDRRATRTRSLVDATRVVGRVRREAGDVAFDLCRSDRGPSSRRQHARRSGRERRSRPIRRRPDEASSSRVYRVRHVSRPPIHLHPQSRARYCRR